MLAEHEMTADPPGDCPWRVGDVVRYTNDYGVDFGPHTVVGFTLPKDELYGRTIYIDYDCYWMPVRPSALTWWCQKELREIRGLT